MTWPADFAPAAPREAILTTWDAFVDELWSGAPAAGATLIAAHFPRAYIDANRAEDDIDPELLAELWPRPLAPTDYTKRGLGLIRRNALPGVPMYDRLLTVADVEQRISAHYSPYRDAVRRHLDVLHERFGAAWHINVHSMKSAGNAMNVDAGSTRPDVVVSDRRGTTADPEHTQWIAEWFRARGLSTLVNTPYLGGDLVVSSGAPSSGRHSIQIELSRGLYLNEASFERGPRFAEVRETCSAFLHDLVSYAAALRLRGDAP
jgi:N-formylglutamate deformylase